MTLSRQEDRRMRDIGRGLVESASGSAPVYAAPPARIVATVTRDNGDGTLDLDMGSKGHPRPIAGIRMSTGCRGVKVGDRVTVEFVDHVPRVTGVVSHDNKAYADDEQVQQFVADITAKTAEIEHLVAGKVDADELDAKYATVESLKATDAEVKRLDAEKLSADEADLKYASVGKLEATEAEIERLDAEKATVGELDAESARIDAIVAENATINGKLTAAEADIESLRAEDASISGKLTAAEAEIGRLDAEKASIKDLDAKYANIDFANIGKAAIENLFSKSGMIGDLVVGDGSITGTLVGVTIKGDLIEGGTVVADKLVLKGEDGLYYKLNTDGETVESEQTDYNSLNGSVITAKSITAEKINVNDLVAFGATIGGYKIGADSLHSGVKDSASSAARGVFMGDDGQFAVGDGSSYLKFFKDSDGRYKLDISASSIRLGTGGTIEEELSDTTVDMVLEYYLSTSRSGLAGGSWSEAAPTWTPGRYVWTRTKTVKKSGDVRYSAAVCVSGNDGEDGARGPQGPQGNPGKDGERGPQGSTGPQGVGVKSSAVTYQAGASGTTIPTGSWSAAIPTVSAGQYLWTRTVIAYTDGKSTTSYSVGRMGQNGSNGAPGAAGKPGAAGVGIKSTSVGYQAGASQTAAPTGAWLDAVPRLNAATPYLWTRTTITYTDGKTSTSYSVGSTLEGVEVGSRNYLRYTAELPKGSANQAEDGITSYVANSRLVKTEDGIKYTYGAVSNDGICVPLAHDGCIDNDEQLMLSFEYRGTLTRFGQLYFLQRTIPNVVLNMPGTPVKSETAWQKYSMPIRSVQANVRTNYMVLMLTHISTDPNGEWIEIRKGSLKLERGNRATDWTPAPEDVQQGIDDAQADADSANNKIEQQIPAIERARAQIDVLSKSIASLVVDQNGGSLMTQTSGGWQFNIGAIQSALSGALSDIRDVKGDVDSVSVLASKTSQLASDVAKKTAYINMTQDPSGKPVMELGQQNGEFRLRITNTSMDFMQGSQRIAYLSNRQLYIQSSVVTDEMKIGDASGFIWKRRASGNLGLRWSKS